METSIGQQMRSRNSSSPTSHSFRYFISKRSEQECLTRSLCMIHIPWFGCFLVQTLYLTFVHGEETSSTVTHTQLRTLILYKPFKRGNYPPPRHWERRAILPNHVSWGQCSADVSSPYINEGAELIQGDLQLIHYSEGPPFSSLSGLILRLQ